ncbi:dihydrofolate reductase family protein [Parasphingorhabdus cellanae]|uniref:Dihydrofolate reductase n=1 Tax=Parasphingorhabdus cellanae TaxID=2806553 RepID=A0ABX7T8T0_9SPHN|nr:dihydrofolate reductase family protein [Parasphingorhabdus cellanae]QTD57333.1 dihydrofolate reductase [Parasphingorhabdus cellanae]
MTTGHVFIATSLDGFIARTNGDIDWLEVEASRDEDHGYQQFIEQMDVIVMGRGTFEKVSSFKTWPYKIPVIVLSRTLSEQSATPPDSANSIRFINADPRTVMQLCADEGWKKAYIDGGQIIQSFLREALIVDLILTRIPVLIGEGKPLFGVIESDVSLRHIKTKAFPSGLTQSRYEVSQ